MSRRPSIRAYNVDAHTGAWRNELSIYLVPLDGSALAEQALPLAKERARRQNASLLLVRVVNPARQLVAASMAGGGMESSTPLDPEVMEAAVQAETKEANDYLQRKGAELKRDGFQVQVEVRTGTPSQELIACAKERQVDLIVITTHGRSGLGRMVFGSVADEVIRTGGIPVLVHNNR
ncbi:MAG: universal stress protein [Dehalococcoidia bacterium]|nr:universal stress protein [Dehalococcoidia bacterium]